MSDVLHLLNGGAGNLAAYLAAHVLLCLLPFEPLENIPPGGSRAIR